jgi:hypothetical protein
MRHNGSASAAWQSGRFEKEGRREASIFFFKYGVFDMTADAFLYAVRLTEWEVGQRTTMHLRSLAADAEPLYRSPTVGRIAIQRSCIDDVCAHSAHGR